MKSRNAILGVLALTVVVALFLAKRSDSPPASPAAPAATVATPQPAAPAPAPVTQEAEVPPYHASAAAAKPFPKIMSPERYTVPAVRRAYAVAARIPDVLAQQPCYCWCNKFGHGSLLDCFASDHGAG